MLLLIVEVPVNFASESATHSHTYSLAITPVTDDLQAGSGL